MKRIRKPNGYWNNKDRCHKESLKYNTRNEFKRGSSGAYSFACKNGWMDDICGHMVILRGKWVYETCKEEASKYEYRSEFRSGSIGAYSVSRKNGWLDDICGHMKSKHSLRDRFIYSYEFYKTKHVYVGLTFDMNIRGREHKKGKSPVYKYMKKYNLTEDDYIIKTHGYYNIKISPQMEKKKEKEYKERGWEILNEATCGSLGRIVKWNTKEKCLQVALKYDIKSRFEKGSSGVFKAAKRQGWLDEICSHMRITRKPQGYWTYDRCKEKALKCKTVTEFIKRSRVAYNKAYKNGWIDDICEHMINGNVKWTYERCKEEALKYNTRTEFRKLSNGAYNKSLKNKWLDEFFPK